MGVQEQGVTEPDGNGRWIGDHRGAPCLHRAGLVPWTFRVGSVNSFGGSFDWDFFLVKCLNLLDIEIIDDWSLKPVSYSVERKN